MGSGLNDELRKNPPKIGTKVTFKYQNLTDSGLPRFPIYLRVYEGV
jgi:DNA ligase-1